MITSNLPQRLLALLAFALTWLFIAATTVSAQSLLNVSYDVARELYKDINAAFVAEWKERTGATVTINQSHGGSSRQALSVISGLEADVVTMNQAPDIDILVTRGGLVAADWRSKYPHGATPYTTTSVFLVRKGNPKGLKDWPDLARPGISVIVPNPKTSGNGRYTYLAAWGYSWTQHQSTDKARAFVTALFANVPVLDGGGRGASTTFTQRDVGDALVTFENEALALIAELGADKFEIVYPSLSIDAPAPVAIVASVANKRQSHDLAHAYLSFLFSKPGQEIIARHHYRPRDSTVLAAQSGRFPAIKTFTVEDALGGWAKVQAEHFADGGIYDQIVVKHK